MPVPKVPLSKVWTFSGSGKEPYQTSKYVTGATSCNCPGWTRRTDENGERYCKHTNWVAMGDAVADRIALGFADREAMLPGAQARARTKDNDLLLDLSQRRKVDADATGL